MNILLPVETINRELDFKLVLAALLANSSNKIFIGQHNFLNTLLNKFENGIYVGKNIFYNFSDKEEGATLQKYKKKGFKVVYLHEEGAVFKGNESDWKTTLNSQYDIEFFDQFDYICTWGDFQKDFDKSRSVNKTNIITTGHPRFDLYKNKWREYYDKEKKQKISVYGDFVLINGNYGLYNHGLGVSYIFGDVANPDADIVERRLDKIKFFKHSGGQCLAMIELTHQLAAKFPDTNFVYRPHPSENQTFYEIIFKGVDNIFVNHEGPVSSWILASKAIIHDGCTTAIEALISNKNVINFKPIYDESTDIWLPNQVGTKATTIEQVISILNNLNKETQNTSQVQNLDKVKSLIYNFENDSYDALLNVIEDSILKSQNSKSKSPNELSIKKEYLKLNLKQKVHQLLTKKGRQNSIYHKRKFYGFDEVYVNEKFGTLEKILNKKIDFTFHNPYLIEVKD